MTRLRDSIPVSLRRRALRLLPDRAWQAMRPMVHGTSPAQLTRRRRAAAKSLEGVPTPNAKVVATADAHRGWIAHPVSRFSSVEVLAESLSLVADALESHGVNHVVLDAQPNRRRVVVVPSSSASAALRALERDLLRKCVYVIRQQARPPQAKLVSDGSIPRDATQLQFFRVLCTPDGRVLSREELGCEVEVWRETTVAERSSSGDDLVIGSWIAPTNRNPWADSIPPVARTVVSSAVDGHPRRRLAQTVSSPHVDSIEFPIDVVYTWVDGGDPEWQVRKAAALDARGYSAPLNASAASPSRFTSRDELRYSLRSLEMYAGWVRHVYLVTDQQTPEWLDADAPGLTVVDHRELFGERGRLPTFNSHAIESQLHHIDGLSEQFLYLNDDVFFGRPVDPHRFFLSNGMSLFQRSRAKIAFGPAIPEEPPVTTAAKNNRDLIAAALGQQPTSKFKHVPHSQRRSVLSEIETTFADAHRTTAASTFRSPSDLAIPSSLAHNYGYLTGKAIPGSIRYFYADIAHADTPERLKSLIAKKDFDVFCLNDHDSSKVDTELQDSILEHFLQTYFPLRSRFERDQPLSK